MGWNTVKKMMQYVYYVKLYRYYIGNTLFINIFVSYIVKGVYHRYTIYYIGIGVDFNLPRIV